MENELILFETADKEIKLTVPIKNNTVWLNRKQLAELFGRDVKTIGKHINNALKKSWIIQLSQILRQLLQMEKCIKLNIII